MKLVIEILKREIAQRELANKHDHLRKTEVESLNKAIKLLSKLDTIIVCPDCNGSGELITSHEFIHCKLCNGSGKTKYNG